MSTLQEKINKDRIEAMKNKNQAVKAATQLLAARFKNEEIELKRALSEEEVLVLVRKELKQTEDSVADAKKAGRDAEEYAQQVAYMTALLPAMMSTEEIAEKVAEAAAGVQPLNKGTLMKAVMPVLKGLADGKDISAAVDAYLAK